VPEASLLPADWRTKNWRLNVYRCSGGDVTTTVDVDEGVTPFMVMCPKCGRDAQSSFYPKSRPVPESIPEPSHEWYRPSETETRRMNHAMREHVKKGGLLLRLRTKREPLSHR
jgi:hypothetical protein